MSYLVIAASLNPESRSLLLARAAQIELQKQGEETALLNLAETPLPFCDGGKAYEDPEVQEIARTVKSANGILMAVPIYNYGVNAAAKNLIELTGQAWEYKVVGFLCAAGGQRSYMAVMSLAGSLMLDFRCLILPRFVYATGEAFEGRGIADPEVEKRIAELAGTLARVSRAVQVAARGHLD
ncbi:MAG: NADPH-dependent FMN reductase [Nitrospinales bacterium]